MREFWQGSTDPNHTCLYNYTWSDWRDGMITAKITAGSGARIVASVHQDYPGGDDFQSYDAFTTGKTRIVVSHLVRSSLWDADIILQNTTSSDLRYDVHFYHQDGSPAPELYARHLDGDGYEALRDLIPSPFMGSVLIVAPLPIVASVKQTRLDLPDWSDAASAYEALGEQ